MEENEKGGLGAFFKNNMDAISKLFVYHIAMCIFGLVVSIALEMLATQIRDTESEWLSVATWIGGVFAMLIYLGLTYVCMWEKGASDKIKIDGGRQKKNIGKGILIWLVASSIDIFILLNIAVLSFIPGAENTHGLITLAGLYYNAMYYPLLWLFSKFEITALYLIVLIPGALTAFLSYLSGVKGQKCIFPEPKGERNRRIR